MKITHNKKQKVDPEVQWSKHEIDVICRYLNRLELSDQRNRDKIHTVYLELIRGPIG